VTKEKLSQALAQVAEIAACVERGDVVLAGQARRTLNELCCELRDGVMTYPPQIVEALRGHGLRETASH